MNVSVAELGLAPGKSMRAQEGTENLVVNSLGLFGDRQYMWVEAQPHKNIRYFQEGAIAGPGQFLSQREDPILTQIIAELDYDGACLKRADNDETLWIDKSEDTPDNRIPVRVWNWQGEAVDQGELAAEWGSELIGRPVRLVAVSNECPRFVENDPRLGRVGFADGYPMLIVSRASVDAVNEWLEEAGKPLIPADRFRANIILDGLEAFGEDLVSTIKVTYGGLSMVLRRAKPCGRCPVPDTNQQTGEVRTDVRSVLGKRGRRGRYADINKYGKKRKIFLGQNFVIEMPENMPEGGHIPIRRGMDIEATLSKDTNWQPA